ncbi:MAG: hypothetical protein HOF95_01110 [Rhodospirillales bacterium]|nr:hypothetical protein [Rhodospirillales bacterium]MBT4006077.1 hypothetical protein [Rhodospirillales bacterium]MBT5112820.1 hypothetical protein [Rhodospirillales bacterium]MBT5673590.1 hypothetical protein [Rhodospirillales bacterium]MBT6186249.1 hypothetical protein [Rhodospirillales bacterium]
MPNSEIKVSGAGAQLSSIIVIALALQMAWPNSAIGQVPKPDITDVAQDIEQNEKPAVNPGGLRPEVQFDVLKHQLDKAIADNNHHNVIAFISKLRETGLPLGDTLKFQEGHAYFQTKQWKKARVPLVDYLNTAGRKGAHYKAAIALFVALESKRTQTAAQKGTLKKMQVLWGKALGAYEKNIDSRNLWLGAVKTLGGAKDDIAWALARDAKGGFVIAGAYQRGSSPEKEAAKTDKNDKNKKKPKIGGHIPWLTGVDPKGRMAWFSPLGGPSKDGSLRSAEIISKDKTSADGFLLGGIHKGFQIALRTDAKGRPVNNHEGKPWITAFAKSDDGAGGIVRRTNAGNILTIGTEIIGGTKQSPKKKEAAKKRAPGPRLPFVLRITPDGKTIRKDVYGHDRAPRWHEITDATVLGNDDVILVGIARSSARATRTDGYILRIDAKGKEKWSKRIKATGAGSLRISTVSAAPDGGIVAAGHEGNRLLILKLDKQGNLQWRRSRVAKNPAPVKAKEFCSAHAKRVLRESFSKSATPPNAEKISAVQNFACKTKKPFASVAAIIARKGGHLVLGFQGWGNRKNTDILLLAIDFSGKQKWQRVYGHDGFDLATAGLETSDGGFIITGATDSTGNGGRDFLLFKVSKTGALAPWKALGPPAKRKAPPRPPKKPDFLKRAISGLKTPPKEEPKTEEPKKIKVSIKANTVVKKAPKPKKVEAEEPIQTEDEPEFKDIETGTDFTNTEPSTSDEPPPTTLGSIFSILDDDDEKKKKKKTSEEE